MSKYVIDDSTLIAIADAVREKDGTSAPIKVSDLGERILAIPAGGADLPEEAFNITGDCQYKFSGSGWNWFLDAYGNRIKTNNITNVNYMFANNETIEEIPFDLNISSSCKKMDWMFNYCKKLKSVPLIKGNLTAPTGNYSGTLGMSNMFNGCNYLKEIPYDYFWNFGDEAFWEASGRYAGDRTGLFSGCHRLKKHPDISMLKTTSAGPYSGIYYSIFDNCYSIEEITGVPVVDTTALTSNCFNNPLRNAHNVKKFTFNTNADGSPIVVQWKNQTLDLTTYVGYTQYNAIITNYTDYPIETWVKDDATYAAFKDNPNYWTDNVNYSKYNHDSAVATLNSLPDSSAYGTNTIKFNGASGAKTDGGAINTLTEAEIAVAAAKGWTVTLA